MNRKLASVLAVAAAAALSLGACSSEATKTADSKTTETQASAEGTSKTLTVFAAASLHQVFKDIDKDVFQKSHPGVEVKFSFEGSSTLLDQLKAGAPADVLATANQKVMKKALEANLVGDPKDFTANTLTMIVPKGNPAKVTGLNESLDNARLVVCQERVPCGSATKKLEKAAGVTLKPASEENKVTDVRAKVESGDADAGLVYKTDAASAKNVEIIDLPAANEIVNKYPIAVVKESKNQQLAEDFMKAVLSDEGQALLEKAGFMKP
ncbi:molybdate ABC transporter substrate-binding protein [Boudabousia liubingyangii]|uniref:Molybdate ABC transporter substrate-binding protein n=1 Tax=Boudabousia liubingyangii TaxID=1921764 RepID=A0A1Q5PQ59_9ACTO|nr:molybdate ABC transporter substrate-binding protein [Boudabousia liubingyangii]OKL49639.1 molybdate ABC transporter substrate-binding protein [Boudabousia liubingyangii]